VEDVETATARMCVYGQMGRKDNGVDPGESHQVKSLRLHQIHRAVLQALP
jgi:hypothetical protein